MVTTRAKSQGGKDASSPAASPKKGASTTPSKKETAAKSLTSKRSKEAKAEGSEYAEEKPANKKQKTESGSEENENASKNGSSVGKASSVLEWLLSDEAWQLSHPEVTQGFGEIDWSDEERRKTPPPESAATNPNVKADDEAQPEPLEYPSTKLNPIQLLICSLLLSKPLSHRLGLRTIKTLFNAPYFLRSARDLDVAGYETRRKAMWDARTQHKEKTAAQLGDLAEGVKKLCDGKEEGEEVDGLVQVRKEAGGDPEKLKEILTKGIKGVGPTGVGIFLRGVQVEWEEFYPYSDERCLKDAARFGLISKSDATGDLSKAAQKLADAVISDASTEQGKQDGRLQRERFVKLLEVLIGLDLEKRVDEAVKKAGAA